MQIGDEVAPIADELMQIGESAQITDDSVQIGKSTQIGDIDANWRRLETNQRCQAIRER